MNASESTSKVLIDPSIPIEELLGSVTTYNNVEGSEVKSLQVRTSARVFKKMKLDSLVVVEKKEPGTKSEHKKSFARPLWTHEDKNWFFQALNEYGKDFDAIYSYICARHKRKGLPEKHIKTKEQIRHLYYRTWHKISKHLKYSDDVKKVAQELYGLINYGELRKKLTSVSAKTTIKLNELIYRGSMAIRVKGKTLRIRTPMCKALRRLNRLDEKVDDIRLPPRVVVEMKPKNMCTWMKVQELSQNPRVKTVLPLQRRLSCVFNCMMERWKSQEVYEQTKLVTPFENSPTDAPAKELLENTKLRTDPLLRLCPPADATITMPIINLSEYFTTQSICLNTYEERIGAKTSGEQVWLDAYPHFRYAIFNKGSSRRGSKRPRAESVSEKSTIKPSPSSTTIDNNENCVVDTDFPVSKVDEINDDAVNTILSLQNHENNQEVVEEKSDPIKVEECCLSLVKKELDIAKIKLGWTINDCATMTVGELYLMFGSDSKLTLEYSWDEPDLPHFNKKEIELCEQSESENACLIEQDNTDNCNNYDKPNTSGNDLSSTLQRLLSVAKLHYRKNIVKCPCGHVCNNASNKTTALLGKTKCNEGDNNKQLVNMQIPSSSNITLPQTNVITTANIGAMQLVMQPQIRTFSPSSLFRRPDSPNDGLRPQTDSKLMPRYCNRRGKRPRTKPVVVERKLPLLANKADSGRQIIQIHSTPELSSPRQIAPKIVPQIEVTNGAELTTTYMEATLTPVTVTSNAATGTFTLIPLEQDVDGSIGNGDIIGSIQAPARVESPTSISNLLDMALQTHVDTGGLDNNGGGTKIEPRINSFQGLLSDNITTSTPPTSPSRILKENENQWLNSEVADFSLSSFLGHLDSPLKTIPSTSEDSRLCLSQDVDAQLQSLLTDSSLDYMAKFADLAAQVNDIKK